jgi:hypothetical protein
MSIHLTIPVAATALLIGACGAGPARALHCGDSVVSEGDTSFQLTQRCGQPTSTEKAEGRPFATPVYDTAKNRYVIQYIPQPYEIWTYNFGPNRLVARISIKDGIITKIEDAGYGN